jgi:uncharacterized protein YecT (DUF1311 family)
MKLRCVIGVLLLSVSPLASYAQDCRDLKDGSTARAGCTAHESFQTEDKALNTVYRKLTAAMNKPESMEVRKRLIASQRAWVSYREQECQFVNDLAGGSGSANMLDCQADMTRERTLYLGRVLEQFKQHAP